MTDAELLSEIRNLLLSGEPRFTPGNELDTLRAIIGARDDAELKQLCMARDLAKALSITTDVLPFCPGDQGDGRRFAWSGEPEHRPDQMDDPKLNPFITARDPWIEMIRMVRTRAAPGDRFPVRVESARVVEDGKAFSITLRPIYNDGFKVMFGEMMLIVPREASRG